MILTFHNLSVRSHFPYTEDGMVDVIKLALAEYEFEIEYDSVTNSTEITAEIVDSNQ